MEKRKLTCIGCPMGCQVEVELEVGGKTLWARISPWARDELAIKPGLWLYAQIKSVSITA